MTDTTPLHPEDLPELALGIEDPARRPALLAHVARCAPCREDLAAMADVADRLAALAPAAEPAAGFEQRVLDRLAARAGPADLAAVRRRRWAGSSDRRPAGAVVAAAVAAAAVAVGVSVPLTLAARGGTPRTQVQDVALTSAQGPVGDVIVDHGGAPWLSMWVEGWAGEPLSCQLVTPSGAVVTVGVFTPGPQGGYWAAPIPAAARRAVTARLVDSAGRVVATARLG